MSMSDDMKKAAREVNKICKGMVPLTDEHWKEAEVAGYETRDMQKKYLQAQAVRGLMEGCEKACRWGATPNIVYDDDGSATMVATCNIDPHTRW
jgi:hypothetical protein